VSAKHRDLIQSETHRRHQAEGRDDRSRNAIEARSARKFQRKTKTTMAARMLPSSGADYRVQRSFDKDRLVADDLCFHVARQSGVSLPDAP